MQLTNKKTRIIFESIICFTYIEQEYSRIENLKESVKFCSNIKFAVSYSTCSIYSYTHNAETITCIKVTK